MNRKAERTRVAGYGAYLLQVWSERRAVDLEQIGPEASTALQRLRKMRDGLAAHCTATEDWRGDPLLTLPEAQSEQFKTTLTVERLVLDLPRMHRALVILVYVQGKRKIEAGEILGIKPNHVTHRMNDAQQMIGEWVTALHNGRMQVAA